MVKNLTLEEMQGLGVTVSGQIMDNGERRYRLMVGEAGYVWTEPPESDRPGWQNAHYHKGVRETYIVQRGRMAFAEAYSDGSYHIQIYNPGEVVTSKPGVEHNVFLFSGTAIHTVKHGEGVGNPEKGGADWYPATDDFDRFTKALPESEILFRAGVEF